MNLDILSTMHLIIGAWKLITIKNYFCKCGFPVDRVYSNDDNELKLTEDDKNDWHGFKILEHNLKTMYLQKCCQVL